MTTVLLTGFEPFHDHAVNPSQLIAERLNGETIAGAAVVGIVLPVVYGDDTRRVFEAIARWKPAIVLSLGLSAGSASLDVEMFAVNHRTVDGSAALAPIDEDGPAAYFSTIAINHICAAITEKGRLPTRRHGYAGAYLCNHVLYQTLRHIAARDLPCRAGFIHLPLATEYTVESEPSLPLEQMVECIRIAIEAAVDGLQA